jgi:acetyl-CoA acetyltransferase
MNEVFILSGVRTPIGKFGGSLAALTSADLGVVAAKAAMEQAAVTRIVVTAVHELLKRKARRGLATLCASGGMGMALAVETCE